MTTISSTAERHERPAAPTLAGAAIDRVLGAGAAVIVAAHLALAIAFVPRWPENLELVAWSAVGVPVAMIAITAVMWRTRAASRALLSVQLLTAAIFAGAGVLSAATGERIITDDVDMWTALAALAAQYLVALGVLARGAWRGVQRWLPIAGASWAVVVLPVVELARESGADWWVFIVYVCAGLIVNGVALAIRPAAGGQVAA